MAFDTNLVALRWLKGKYDVVSSIPAEINIDDLQRNQRLNDVSSDLSFADFATILSYTEFEKYLLPESVSWSIEARKWYASIPNDATFIMVHRAEWESGLG